MRDVSLRASHRNPPVLGSEGVAVSASWGGRPVANPLASGARGAEPLARTTRAGVRTDPEAARRARVPSITDTTSPSRSCRHLLGHTAS